MSATSTVVLASVVMPTNGMVITFEPEPENVMDRLFAMARGSGKTLAAFEAFKAELDKRGITPYPPPPTPPFTAPHMATSYIYMTSPAQVAHFADRIDAAVLRRMADQDWEAPIKNKDATIKVRKP